MKPALLLAAVCAGTGSLLAGCAKDGGRDHLVYYLKKPLRVYTVAPGDRGKRCYELPAGTALYLAGHRRGETLERYKVYINVEGGLLKGEHPKHAGEIDPLHAWLDTSR